MKRFILILFILVVMTGCGRLGPSSADSQKSEPVVNVKSDGENLVLIPKEAGKAYVILGYLRDEKGENLAGSSGPLPYFVGEQKIPAKDYSKLVVGEIRWKTEVDVHLPEGSSNVMATAQPCICDLPIPPLPSNTEPEPSYRILGTLSLRQPVEGMPPG